jgi:hypothetical protein
MLCALDSYLFIEFFLRVHRLGEVLTKIAGASRYGFVSGGEFHSSIIPVYEGCPRYGDNFFQSHSTVVPEILTHGNGRSEAAPSPQGLQAAVRRNGRGDQRDVRLDTTHCATYLYGQSSNSPLEIEVRALEEIQKHDSTSCERRWKAILQATWDLLQRTKDEYKFDKFGFVIMPREGHHVRLTIIPTAFSDPSRDITHDPEAFHETYSGSLTDNLWSPRIKLG